MADACFICMKPIVGEELHRHVSTPQGRMPTHQACYQKGLDIDAAALLPPAPRELPKHITIDPKMQPEPTEETMSDSKAVTLWDEKLAAMADEYAQGERVGGDFISLKGGVLSFQDEPMPGNQMLVVILDAVTERTFYAEKYDASRERNAPPVCYAFGRPGDDDDMGPHPSMQRDLTYFQPQNDTCRGCPNDAWGTADTGKGKACAERRRMAVLPAGYFAAKRGSRDFDMHIIEDQEHYEKADIAYLKLNVMSVKDWARYVQYLAQSLRRPPMAVITRVYVEPDAKSQFRVKFEMVQELPAEFFETIMARHDEAKESIVFGYNPPGEEAEGAPQPSRRVRR